MWLARACAAGENAAPDWSVAKVQLQPELILHTARGPLAGRRRLHLLRAIAETGSITKAAKAVGLSYKAAWDAVEAMNNLADGLLVERTVGGRGGGGAKLTERGARLVETFRMVEFENERFVARVNRRVQNGEDLRTLGKLAMMTSARNHFAGKVVRIAKGAVNDEVELKLSGGERIVAVITHESTQTLGLKKGVEAIALVKASWVIVAVEDGPPLKLSARNRLEGKVRKVTPGAVNSEVVIELKGGLSVAAVITNVAARELKLAPGVAASAIFKASSVILGVAA